VNSRLLSAMAAFALLACIGLGHVVAQPGDNLLAGVGVGLAAVATIHLTVAATCAKLREGARR
jgi:hypothetical protein